MYVGQRAPGQAKTVSVVREKTKKPTPASAVGAASNVVPGALGPQSIDADRDAWANALDTMGQVYTPDPLTAIAKVAGMGLAGYGQGKAVKAKEEGTSAYRAKLAEALSGEPGNDDLMGLMNDPYADDQSQRMIWDMYERNNKPPEQPEYDMQTGADGKLYYVPKVPGQGQAMPVEGFTPQAGSAPDAPKVDTYKTVDPATNEPIEITREWVNGQWQEVGRAPYKPGGVTVDARQMGTIPPGYRVEYDENGQPLQMVPITGGPAAAEAEKADSAASAQQNKRMTLTDTVTNAADTARGLIGMQSTGLIGQGMSYLGESDAAEIYRQIEVMKSNAKIENLTAMRRESPTGGALGAVSDKENEMLAAAAGALDPSSGPERFAEQLDNYEMTLLRVIHGYDAGTQMFEQRKAQQAAQARQGGQGADAAPPNVDPELWRYMTPEERQLWQAN